MDREDAVESGDLEDLGDVAVAAHERELAIVRPQALHPADEHTERGRVDEGRVGEVDDDITAALVDDLEQLLLELRRGVRSTSPAREITYCSLLSFSVLTSKFI